MSPSTTGPFVYGHMCSPSGFLDFHEDALISRYPLQVPYAV